MNWNEERLLSMVEPIFRFCYGNVSNRQDAEDLAGEIICYVLEELFARRVLEMPKEDEPFVKGVFYVEGEYLDI